MFVVFWSALHCWTIINAAVLPEAALTLDSHTSEQASTEGSPGAARDVLWHQYQKWKTMESCSVIQKSAPISNMDYMITSFLLLHAADFILSFPVTASQGGNRSIGYFCCKSPGCATDVTHVFCNNELVFKNSHIAQCTGPPPPNTVCQNDGRAFVSTDTDGDCEFEGDARIETLKCTDQSDICVFISATTPSPLTAPPQVTTERPQNDKHGQIAGGVFGALLLLLIIGSLLYICVKRYQNQPPASDSGETVNLRAMQSSGDTSNSDTQGGPGLDDDSSPHRDRGV